VETSSSDYFYLVSIGLSSQMEKMTKQVEMEFYPSEGFTKMYKDGYVED
jgi:hypothetical protein